MGEGGVDEDEKSDIPYGENIWVSSTCINGGDSNSVFSAQDISHARLFLK